MAKVLQSWIRFTSRINLKSTANHLSRRAAQRCFSSENNSSSKGVYFGNSVILLQDGLNIEELPIAVRRANDKFLQVPQKEHSEESPPESKPDLSLVSLFLNCGSVEQVLQLLDTLNTEEVTPGVATQALIKISELGRNVGYRNMGVEADQSFTLDAVLGQLGQIITKSGSTEDAIMCLKLVILPSFPSRAKSLRGMLSENCLERVLDNSCTTTQVCQIIRLFVAMSQPNWADKCWVGLLGRQVEPKEILTIFRILSLLKDSQRAVFNHLERYFIESIHQLDEQTVCEILDIVRELKLFSKRVCITAAKWMSINLHIITEDGMQQLLSQFNQLDYYEPHLTKVIERYFKSKSVCKNQELIRAASNYCHRTRICSAIILDPIANGFIEIAKEISVKTVEAVLVAFGHLGFSPSDEFSFWIAVEESLDRKLVEFRPDALLDVLLSCIYLQRYPMNFMPRVFSPHFIHRLHSHSDEAVVESSRTKMKILDAAMSFECTQYGTSRVLPKDYYAKAASRDGRVLRLSSNLVAPLGAICGPSYEVHQSVVLKDLPLHEIYVIDLLISPAGEAPVFRYGRLQQTLNRSCTVIMIHPPEHYVHHLRSGKKLTGVQHMRQRHFNLMGFKVVDMDSEELFGHLGNREALQVYLDSKLSSKT